MEWKTGIMNFTNLKELTFVSAPEPCTTRCCAVCRRERVRKMSCFGPKRLWLECACTCDAFSLSKNTHEQIGAPSAGGILKPAHSPYFKPTALTRMNGCSIPRLKNYETGARRRRPLASTQNLQLAVMLPRQERGFETADSLDPLLDQRLLVAAWSGDSFMRHSRNFSCSSFPGLESSQREMIWCCEKDTDSAFLGGWEGTHEMRQGEIFRFGIRLWCT
jgi:hypothetical protein